MIEFPATGDPLCDRLAFGTGRLSRGSLANVEATLRRAYDLGVRHFDSSIAYDNGASHAALGRLIRDVPENDLFISTKIGLFQETFPGFKKLYRDAGALRGVVHECYRSLLGKIDLLQIHEADSVLWWDDNPDSYQERYIAPITSLVPGQAPVMDVVLEAKRLGVCTSIGVTANTARPLAEAVRRLPVDSVLCAYNLDPVFRGALEHVLPAARQRGAALLAAGVLQGGTYIDRNNVHARLLDWPAIPQRLAELDQIAAEAGLSVVELLLRWSLSVSGVDRWVLGAETPEQIDGTIAILRRGPLPSDLQSALDNLAVPGIESANEATRWLAGLI